MAARQKIPIDTYGRLHLIESRESNVTPSIDVATQ
jgi:hypothetical protein